MGFLGSEVVKAASTSADGVYRYLLSRNWGIGKAVLFIMLNPSTADHQIDDPTIRRCMGLTRKWNYRHLLVANLFAYRATNPLELHLQRDPIGPENPKILSRLISDDNVDRVVVAWGNRGTYRDRDIAFWSQHGRARQMYHLGDLTARMQPRHPLYVPNDVSPRVFDLLHVRQPPKYR